MRWSQPNSLVTFHHVRARIFISKYIVNNIDYPFTQCTAVNAFLVESQLV